MVLIDGVGRRNSHGIITLRIDSRQRIRCALVAFKELCASNPLRELHRIVLLEFRRRNIRQVTAPTRVINANSDSRLRLGYFEASQGSEDAVAHECSGADRTIIRT